MIQIKKENNHSVRISITVPAEELEKWQSFSRKTSLSAFIREAVNEYVKIQEPNKKTTVFDLFLEQRSNFQQIHEELTRLENIEGNIVDIAAAMAKFDMIDLVEHDGQYSWEVKKKK
jgi:metal-responsive CopG/Arc/MetJ family transcriptional regulator